jgi:hypothetical protein
LPIAIELVASAGQHVQHARRHAGALRQFGRARADSGVCSAGLMTTGQPAASAGRHLARDHRDREVPRA